MKQNNWETPHNWTKITTIEMHTGGEPLRIPITGLPEITGDTILEKRRFFKENHDNLRTAMMFEPRGHADNLRSSYRSYDSRNRFSRRLCIPPLVSIFTLWCPRKVHFSIPSIGIGYLKGARRPAGKISSACGCLYEKASCSSTIFPVSWVS